MDAGLEALLVIPPVALAITQYNIIVLHTLTQHPVTSCVSLYHTSRKLYSKYCSNFCGMKRLIDDHVWWLTLVVQVLEFTVWMPAW